MKTAVSLPDAVFSEAERLARRLKKSRSELYGDALREYLGRHAVDAVTEKMDEVCRELDARPDGFAKEAARRVLERTEW